LLEPEIRQITADNLCDCSNDEQAEHLKELHAVSVAPSQNQVFEMTRSLTSKMKSITASRMLSPHALSNCIILIFIIRTSLDPQSDE